MKEVEERESKIVDSSRRVQYPRKKQKNQPRFLLTCCASTIPSPGDAGGGGGGEEEEGERNSGFPRVVSTVLSPPLHPFMAQGVLQCRGSTSRPIKKLKRRNASSTSPTHARKNTHTRKKEKKKEYPEELDKEGGWRKSCEKSSAGVAEKESKLFEGPKTELSSATMTNQLCALAGSNSTWVSLVRLDKGKKFAVNGEKSNSPGVLKMIETMDTQRALQAVERLQAKLKERGEVPTEEKLSLLKSVLQSPLFHQILALQKSVQHLRDQGSVPASRGSDLSDHVAAVKPNGGHVSYSDTSAAAHVNGKTSPEEFEHVIHSMAQPVSGGLGFSVVGLKSENRGELGIFIQEIQPGSIAHCDGKLKEADQILAINGQPLDQTVTHQQAIGMLQSASERVQLTVARGPIPQLASPVVSRTPSAASTLSANSSAWQHVETIELVNDGTGLGFGIVGGKTTGVIVKTILPGGIADQDGRLRSGDHILRIGETDLYGMGSEQVAQVLRQCGNRVKLVVTRGPVDENPSVSAIMPVVLPTVNEQQDYEDEEAEAFDVNLTKNAQGLGITIAGYVGDKNSEPSGIFVKSITKDSAVDQDGRIHVGDQIIAVDGVNIQGYTNQQAVEVLRHTGQTVHLKLIRRGFKPD
ncbi:Multiple PDZ domain protein [Larimichthys crocea]|uniref:Uncharacterized protein n=1 Tax=Larimichthys crocea TaxID=215358 RepID=A0ACD3Q638_LARCR|nr:Multiple PDZ domain protein [Larimichthys crocea]